MIQKILKRRRVLIIVMILTVIFIIGFGIHTLAKTSVEIMETMSTNRLDKLAEHVEGICGTVYDCNNIVLWDENENGHEATYSVVGDIRSIFIENTVAVRQEDTLVDVSKYNIYQGIESLKNTGMNLYLTLDYDLSADIHQYMVEHGVKKGSVLVIDAKTGAIKAAVSLPSWNPDTSADEAEEGAFVNKNFSTTIPGSTMKLVTAILLLQYNPDIAETSYECTGSVILDDGTEIKCHGVHGRIGLVDAIGLSCNSYYANAVSDLNRKSPVACVEMLRTLGFSDIRQEQKKIALDESEILYESSCSAYDGTNTFDSVWPMIGEGLVEVSPVDMCKMISMIVNHGEASAPYVLQQVTDKDNRKLKTHRDDKTQIIDQNVADRLYEYWKTAFEKHYINYNPGLTIAKTGTAEYDNDMGNSKLLIGYMQEKGLVFFIEIADYQGGILPIDIANYIASRE